MGLECNKGESRRNSHPMLRATCKTAHPHTGDHDVAAQRSKRQSSCTCLGSFATVPVNVTFIICTVTVAITVTVTMAVVVTRTPHGGGSTAQPPSGRYPRRFNRVVVKPVGAKGGTRVVPTGPPLLLLI